MKVGGYFRGEYQYTPGKDIYAVNGNTIGAVKVSSAATSASAQTTLGNQWDAANAAASTTLTGATAAAAKALFVGSMTVAETGAAATTATGTATNYYLGGNSTTTGYTGTLFRSYVADATKANTPAAVGIVQRAAAQSDAGYETRGRIDVDARSPTDMGVVRTFLRLRAANTSGARNATYANNAVSGQADASSTGISIESALVQWAGFTFGVATENFTQMPSVMYNGNPFTGFPNGMKQIAYTATFGGGLSATVALEDRLDSFQGSASGPAGANYVDKLATAANLVANVRLDQSWGFASVAGMLGNNSVRSDYGYNSQMIATPGMTTSGIGATALGFTNSYTSTFAATPTLLGPGSVIGTVSPGQATFSAWAVGATINIKLPMLAAGDQIWLNANYGHGMLGATGSSGGMNNLSTSATHRLIGGIVRNDQNLMVTGGNGSYDSPYTMGTVNSWNVAGVFTHYWAPKWRTNVSAGYIQVNTPTSTATATDVVGNTVSLPQWGKGSVWEVGGNIIYSPVKDFDIGVELQYSSMKNTIQNTATAICVANGACGNAAARALTIPEAALKGNNITTKLRVERAF